MTVRVLIVDDDLLVRAGLRKIIETQEDLEVVGEAGDGLAAIELANKLQPHVVLMDIRMPGMDGLEATRQIAKPATTALDADPDSKSDSDSLVVDAPRVLVLTTFELDEYVYEAVRAGASGFLLKRTPPEDLLEGLRIVASGEALLAPSVTRRLMKEFTRATAGGPQPTEVRNRELDRLTEREREVLLLMSRGLANKEIAAELYVAENTIKTHVKRILMKLQLRDRVHAVVFAYETGLLEPGER